MTNDQEDKLLTIEQAADRVSVSRTTINRLLRDGELTRRRMAGTKRLVRISSRELDDLFRADSAEAPETIEGGDTRA